MAELALSLWDAQGNVLESGDILCFCWQAQRALPYETLQVQTTLPSSKKAVSRVRAYLGGELLFSGAVRSQTRTVQSGGQVFDFCARSSTAALLDKQALPRAYQYYPVRQLLADHAYPFGVSGADRSEGLLEHFCCTQGMTHWDALCLYYRQVYGITPFLNHSAQLLSHIPDGDALSLSARDCAEFSCTQDLDSLISRMLVLDQNQVYHSVQNRLALSLGAGKTVYYTPPGRWAGNLAGAVSEKLARSQLDYLRVCLTLPGLFRYELGQAANISGAGQSYTGLRLGKIALRGDENGLRTELEFWDGAAEKVF